MILTPSQIKSYWLGAGGSQSDAIIMTAIGLAESSGNTNAVNRGVGKGGKKTNEYSIGIWQINTLVHKNHSIEELKKS